MWHTGSAVVAHGLSCSTACGIFPDQRSNLCPLHWQADSFFFFNLWLCWVFVSVRGLSLVPASGGHSSSRCAGLSLSRPLFVAEHRLQTRRLSSCGSQAQLLRGTWDPPRPGLKPVSTALAGRLSTTAPPGKPRSFLIPSFLQVILSFPQDLGLG